MHKVGICGNFGGDTNAINGQTVKTKILKDELAKVIGEKEIMTIDSYGWKSKPMRLLADCFCLIKNCKNVIIMPAHNGLKVFLPLFVILNNIYKRKIHYVVIGGWLPDYLKENKFLIKYIKKVDSIHVETYSMIKGLKDLGINNVYYMPNFKGLQILSKDELIYPVERPYKLCTFSRVMKEKGIEDIINVVSEINKKNNTIVYSLDIYGPIDENYKQRFFKILEYTDDFINYKGIVPYDKSVETISNYFILIFPTLFKTEGVPGTIIDSYAAGVPVIASNWNSHMDVIDANVTGIIFNMGDTASLLNKLEKACKYPEKILEMKENCLNKALEYSPYAVISEFLEIIDIDT